jgi:hypothetical protein
MWSVFFIRKILPCSSSLFNQTLMPEAQGSDPRRSVVTTRKDPRPSALGTNRGAVNGMLEMASLIISSLL